MVAPRYSSLGAKHANDPDSIELLESELEDDKGKSQ